MPCECGVIGTESSVVQRQGIAAWEVARLATCVCCVRAPSVPVTLFSPIRLFFTRAQVVAQLCSCAMYWHRLSPSAGGVGAEEYDTPSPSAPPPLPGPSPPCAGGVATKVYDESFDISSELPDDHSLAVSTSLDPFAAGSAAGGGAVRGVAGVMGVLLDQDLVDVEPPGALLHGCLSVVVRVRCCMSGFSLRSVGCVTLLMHRSVVERFVFYFAPSALFALEFFLLSGRAGLGQAVLWPQVCRATSSNAPRRCVAASLTQRRQPPRKHQQHEQRRRRRTGRVAG